jgi:hypothetical protein
MPVTYQPYENGRIVRLNITDPWSTSDLLRAYSDEMPIFDTAPGMVHTLVDLSQAHQIPPGVLGAHRGSPHVSHTNRGEIVIIGAGSLLTALVETAAKVIRFKNVKFCNSEAEAWDYLYEILAEDMSVEAKHTH